jgi:hypothetical protein
MSGSNWCQSRVNARPGIVGRSVLAITRAIRVAADRSLASTLTRTSRLVLLGQVGVFLLRLGYYGAQVLVYLVYVVDLGVRLERAKVRLIDKIKRAAKLLATFGIILLEIIDPSEK